MHKVTTYQSFPACGWPVGLFPLSREPNLIEYSLSLGNFGLLCSLFNAVRSGYGVWTVDQYILPVPTTEEYDQVL